MDWARTMKPELNQDLTDRISRMPEYDMGTHLVTVILRDGRRVRNVVVAPCSEIWGIGFREKADEAALGFLIADIVGVEHQPWQHGEERPGRRHLSKGDHALARGA